MILRYLSTFGFLLLLASASACSGNRPAAEERLDAYRQALAASESAAGELAVADARRVFTDFYRDFEPEAIRENAPRVFAPDAYLNDQLRELEGVEAITDYLVEAAESFAEAGFEVHDAAKSGDEHYFRWTMTFRLAGSPDEPPIVAPGVSHVRFDEQGRIVFQRDYWDTASAIYERIPLLGGLMRAVQKRF